MLLLLRTMPCTDIRPPAPEVGDCHEFGLCNTSKSPRAQYKTVETLSSVTYQKLKLDPLRAKGFMEPAFIAGFCSVK